MIGASLFSGGRLAEALLGDAIEMRYAVEYDPAIAAVGAQFGGQTIVARVEDVDYAAWGRLDYLHASPVCKEYSQAKAGGTEGESDLSSAAAVVRCLGATQPRVFTLENVGAYQHGQAYRLICAWLNQNGYMWHASVVNAADYGGWIRCPIHAVSSVANYSPKETAPDIAEAVAMMWPADQARFLAWDVAVRLVKATQQDIVGAAIWRKLESAGNAAWQILDGRADDILTSAAMSEFGLMGSTTESIESLLKECLGDHLLKQRWSTTSMETRLITLQKIFKCLRTTDGTRHTTTHNAAVANCPLCKYTAVPQTRRRLILQAVRDALLPPLPAPEPWIGWYAAIEDLIPTLPDSQFAPWQLARLPEEMTTRLFAQGKFDDRLSPADRQEPAFTMTANSNQTHLRAFVLDCQESNAAHGLTVRQDDDPMYTITAGTKRPARAWLVSAENTNAHPDTLAMKADHEPALTVRGSLIEHGASPRAWLAAGRTVRMTPRALARFQSVPDTYVLPDKAGLACQIIGNGVPSLLMRKLALPLLGVQP